VGEWVCCYINTPYCCVEWLGFFPGTPGEWCTSLNMAIRIPPGNDNLFRVLNQGLLRCRLGGFKPGPTSMPPWRHKPGPTSMPPRRHRSRPWFKTRILCSPMLAAALRVLSTRSTATSFESRGARKVKQHKLHGNIILDFTFLSSLLPEHTCVPYSMLT
jgi:hypothetical protein